MQFSNATQRLPKGMDVKRIEPDEAFKIWRQLPAGEAVQRAMDLHLYYVKHISELFFNGNVSSNSANSLLFMSYIWNSGRIQGKREERAKKKGMFKCLQDL